MWYKPSMDIMQSLRRPGRTHCHLWVLPIETLKAGQSQLEAALSTGERHRAEACLRDADRDRFSLGRAALRRLLAAYSGVEAGALIIRVDERGKPHLPAGYGPAFSVAHSGEMLLLAFSGAEAIGVDVEQVRALTAWPGVIDSVLHPSEKAAMNRLPPAARPGDFFSYWTLKEALSKAAGLGLALPFPEVHIARGGDSVSLVEVPMVLGHTSNWWLQPVAVWGTYRAGLAVRGQEVVVTSFDGAAFEHLNN